MRRALGAIVPILIVSAAFAEETVSLAARPKRPQAGRVLELREVFRISDAQGGFFFKSPEQIQPAPDGGVLVVDEGQFLRFDKAGKFVANMFHGGEGPGELRQIDDYVVGDAEVLAFQKNPRKCIGTSLDGKPRREVKPDSPVSRLLGRSGDRLLAATHAFPAIDKVQKPEGEILEILWSLKLMSEGGHVESTSLTFPTKMFAKRVPDALIADNLTSLLCAPLAEGLVAVANEEGYVVHIVDPARDAAVRTIRRDYRRVKYEPRKPHDAPAGPRRLTVPRDHFNDIQRLFAVDERIWVVTSTLEPGKGFQVDVISPDGEYLDSFFLPLAKAVGLHHLGRHPLTIAGNSLLILEALEDGRLEVVKYEIVDPVRP